MSETILDLSGVEAVLPGGLVLDIERLRVGPGERVAIAMDPLLAANLAEVLADRGFGGLQGGTGSFEGDCLLGMTPDERTRRGLFVPAPMPGAMSEIRDFLELLERVRRVRSLAGSRPLPTLEALRRSGLAGAFERFAPRLSGMGDSVHSLLVQGVLAEARLTVLVLDGPLDVRSRVALEALVAGTDQGRALLVLGDVGDLVAEDPGWAVAAPPEVREPLPEAV